MRQKELGRSGEKIPSIGMGTWKMNQIEDQKGRQDAIASLRRGVELGSNLIDTAEIYGSGVVESILGEALKGTRDEVFLVTKVFQNHLKRDDVVAACEGSLRRLGTDHIDLYLVHWPNPEVPIRETMAAMESLVKNGKIRHIGVSNFSTEQMREASESLSKSELVVNQVPYSPSDMAIEKDVLPYCEREGVTVMAYSPLAKGALVNREIPKSILDKYRITPVQAMLAWVTKKERVVAIPKAAKLSHVEENAKAGDVALSEEDYGILSKSFR
jgi:diketogulonate reductase-like aldo/keto reductase